MKDGPITRKRPGDKVLGVSLNYKKSRVQSAYKVVAAKTTSHQLSSCSEELNWDGSKIEELAKTTQFTTLSAVVDNQSRR